MDMLSPEDMLTLQNILTPEDSTDIQTAFIMMGRKAEPEDVDGKQLEMEVDTSASGINCQQQDL